MALFSYEKNTLKSIKHLLFKFESQSRLSVAKLFCTFSFKTQPLYFCCCFEVMWIDLLKWAPHKNALLLWDYVRNVWEQKKMHFPTHPYKNDFSFLSPSKELLKSCCFSPLPCSRKSAFPNQSVSDAKFSQKSAVWHATFHFTRPNQKIIVRIFYEKKVNHFTALDSISSREAFSFSLQLLSECEFRFVSFISLHL